VELPAPAPLPVKTNRFKGFIFRVFVWVRFSEGEITKVDGSWKCVSGKLETTVPVGFT